MLRKILVATGIFLGTFAGNAAAQEVTVMGFGADRNSAIRDAARFAVEQVAGTFIDARTLMENLVIQLDEVYKNSSGFVRNIQILDENSDSGVYRVRAKIDVDTNPNSALVDRLTMIMQLNDPRISVFAYSVKISENVQPQPAENYEVEDYLVEKLLDAGFNHVTRAQYLQSENFSETDLRQNLAGKTTGADYLIFCRCTQNSRQAKIPAYGEKITETPTNFYNAKTNLRVEILKCDTGEIIGTFAADGKGMELGEDSANRAAAENSATAAAEKLVNTFKKISGSVTLNLTFKINADNYAALEKIIAEIRAIGWIENLYVREISGGTAILSIDSSQKPNFIVEELRNRTRFGVSVENMTNSSCVLRIN